MQVTYQQFPDRTAWRRGQIRKGSRVFLLGALIAVGGAILLPGDADDPGPTRVNPGVALVLPELGFNRSGVRLIGPKEPDASTGPGLAVYGCSVSQPTTSDTPLWDQLYPLPFPDPVDGRQMYPLVGLSGYVKGSTLVCSGPKAEAVQPMYLIGTTSGIPLGGRIFFALCGVLFGCIGIILRAASRGPR